MDCKVVYNYQKFNIDFMNTEIFRRSILKTTTFKHIFIPFLIALIFQLFYIVFMKRGYQKRIIPSVTVNILSSIPVVCLCNQYKAPWGT